MNLRIPTPYLLTREEEGLCDAFFVSGGLGSLSGGLEGKKKVVAVAKSATTSVASAVAPEAPSAVRRFARAADKLPMWSLAAILGGGVLLLAAGVYYVVMRKK